jgi:hypothetical protein
VAGHRVSGRGDGASHRARHAGRVARTAARTRYRRPARRRACSRRRAPAQRNHRPGQAHDPRHPAALVGLPEQYPQARFCLWLHSQGYFDKVEASVEAAGKAFDKELNNLYVSGPIAKALLACDRAMRRARPKRGRRCAKLPADGARHHDRRVPLGTVKEALKLHGRDGRTPCVLLILDEVQQYIGESNDRSVLVTEVAEAVCKQLDSQVMIVGAGQSALTDVPLLQKLMDRFTIRVPLSDAEVEQVTRKVLLHKKPASVARFASCSTPTPARSRGSSGHAHR